MDIKELQRLAGIVPSKENLNESVIGSIKPVPSMSNVSEGDIGGLAGGVAGSMLGGPVGGFVGSYVGDKLTGEDMDESVDDDIDSDEAMQTMMDDEYSEELLLPAGSRTGEYGASDDVGFGEEDPDDFDDANDDAYPEYDMPAGEEDYGFDVTRMQQLAGIREADGAVDIMPRHDDAMRYADGMDMDQIEGEDLGMETQLITAGTRDRAEYMVELLSDMGIDAKIQPKDRGGYYVKFRGDKQIKADIYDAIAHKGKESEMEESYDDKQVLPDQYADEIPPEEGFPNGFDSTLDHRLNGVMSGNYGDNPRIKRESVEMNRMLKLAGLPEKKLVAESVNIKRRKKIEEGSVEEIHNKLTEAFKKFCEDTIAICANPEDDEEEMEEGIEQPMAVKKEQARKAMMIRKFNDARKAREQKPEYSEKTPTKPVQRP